MTGRSIARTVLMTAGLLALTAGPGLAQGAGGGGGGSGGGDAGGSGSEQNRSAPSGPPMYACQQRGVQGTPPNKLSGEEVCGMHEFTMRNCADWGGRVPPTRKMHCMDGDITTGSIQRRP
ncbi:MAG TPA: hypothetical protein VIL65_12680 [Beijerinckiaceae bacterium]|jgi:hypothetical protein